MMTGKAIITALALVSALSCVSPVISQPSIRLVVTKKGLDYCEFSCLRNKFQHFKSCDKIFQGTS